MNKEDEDAFEAACTVYFGTYIDHEDIMGESPDTPETLFMQKEAIENMPTECKTMLKIILDLPEEMWQSGGFINAYGMKKVVKNLTKWPMTKVLRVESKLRECLQHA